MNGNLAERPLVLVVGGGFGGLNVVQGLKDAPVRILLVDKRNHHLF
jgi:NADH dehydrogenase